MPKKKGRSPPFVPPSSKFARVLASAAGSLSLPGNLPISDSPPPLPGVSTPSSSSAPVVSLVETRGTLPPSPSELQVSSPVVNPVSEISSTAVDTGPPASSSEARPNLNSASSSGLVQEASMSPPNTVLPWASKFKASLRNLKKMSPPTFLEDGTPVVVAPASVLLKTAAMWKGHIVAQFHGLCPPPAKIYADLNPIWGRFGNITIRKISETAALIFIPSVTTREWVVEVGFWQAGNCSCTVYPWSSEGPLELEDLQSAPTWAILKNVPPQLYSLEGISVIASAIGDPLHTEKSRLDPVNIGATKVKVVIQLNTTLLTTVVVKDIQGNTARVAVEYPRPPPKCLNCGRYGHLLSRCPQPLMKKLPFKKDIPTGSKEITQSKVSLSPIVPPADISESLESSIVAPRISKPKRRRSRSKNRSRSTPPILYVPKVLASAQLQTKVPEHVSKSKLTEDLSPGSRKHSSSSQTVTQDVIVEAKASPTMNKAKAVVEPFPLPPGWGVMTSKARKKYRRKWTNGLLEAGSNVFVPGRGESSIRKSHH